MPQSKVQADVIPLPQAINKYLELCLFLLVLMGFGTLASTGALDFPAIVLAGAAFALRGYLLAKRKRIVISDRWTTPLTILYGVFYAADYLLLSRAFLPATVHLVLFAVGGGANFFFTARSRLHHVGSTGFSHGAGLRHPHGGQRVSVFLFRLHVAGRGNVRFDGNAAFRAIGKVSRAPLAG